MKLSQSGGGRGGGGGGQKRKRKVTEEDGPEAAEHSVRVKEAVRKGQLTTTSYGDRRDAKGKAKAKEEDGDGEWEEAYAGMTVSKQILKSDGLDIVKKGRERKNRYLLVFSGWLQLAKGAKAGKLGTLKDVDTQNPSLCVDFPKLGGTLKMLGTIVFPSTKCAILNFEAKKQIVIDEIFDSMIVFSKANWIRWGPTGVDTSSDGNVEVEGLPSDVLEKLEKEVQETSATATASATGEDANTEDYRCGATTGEPTVVRVKREAKKKGALVSALETFNGNSKATLPLAGDLEELDTEEELELEMEIDQRNDSESEDSDESFRVGGNAKRKRKAAAALPKDSKVGARAKAKPKAKSKSSGGSGSASRLQGTRGGGVKKRAAAKKEIKVDLISDDDQSELDGDGDDESDWSGMD